MSVAVSGSPAGLRQSMAGLHTWTGVLAGWLLYAVFITGGISFFREELTQWLRPEIPARPAQLDQAAVARHALATLARQAATADRWQVDLPGTRRNATEAAWETGGAGERALFDPATGTVLHPRDTLGGEFFYYFHFSLHYLPGTLGRWIVGLCAAMALVAMISGIIVHRRIFSDFFTFRPHKGQRSWLDAHNATSVFSLPFHLMIVYTGLVTLMFTYLPWGALAAFGTQQARPALAKAMQPRFDTPARTGIAAPLADVAPMFAQAHARWGADEAGRMIVTHPGDTSARIAIVRTDASRLTVVPSYLLFDGASGKLLAAHDGSGPALAAWGAAYALHLGRFADPVLRWLYFLSSMLGAAMVGTGMLLWTAKRRQRGGSPGLRLVEAGNIACIAGLAIAVPGFLLANRLLPAGLPDRAQWEVHGFFLCWGIAAFYAAIRPAARAWRDLPLAAALLWLSLIVAGWTTARGLPATGQSRDNLFIAFDLAFACVAALALAVALRSRR